MCKLTATYEIELAHSIRVKRAANDAPQYHVVIDGFEVKIDLLPDGASVKAPGDKFETRRMTRVTVSVSRDEKSAPPNVVRNKAGGQNFTDRSAWFKKIGMNEYKAVAVKAMNRFSSFCKYELKIPNVGEFRIHDNQFNNPDWYGEGGIKINPGIVTNTFTIISKQGPALLSQQDLTADFDDALRRALQSDQSMEPHQEFLVDAQTSIVNGKLKRALLELAIACEVAIKNKFSNALTIKRDGTYYKFGKNGQNKRVSVIVIIDAVAKEMTGDSFKNAAKDVYEHIVFLFRSRNMVAHRGEASYCDYSNELIKVERPTLQEWWFSVEKLMKWLDKLPPI